MSLNFLLDNKIAIVTGSGKGIGKQIALAFAKAGADVVICGRNSDSLNETARELTRFGHDVMVEITDIRKLGDIKELVQKTIDHFGKIDILVNNAGVNQTGPTMEVTEETWDKILDTNLKGAFFCCQEAGRHMLERKKGKIINISSIAGDWGVGFNVPYCSSKGGLKLLTQALALEWAPHGINVNAIGPGYFLTDQVKWAMEDPLFGAKIRAKMPMRVGELEDIEGAAVFLASEASDYINGRTIYVDGAQAVGWMGPE